MSEPTLSLRPQPPSMAVARMNVAADSTLADWRLRRGLDGRATAKPSPAAAGTELTIRWVVEAIRPQIAMHNDPPDAQPCANSTAYAPSYAANKASLQTPLPG
jgi:hypothetical protein